MRYESLVKLNAMLNMMPSLTLKAQKSSFGSLGASLLPRLEKELLG